MRVGVCIYGKTISGKMIAINNKSVDLMGSGMAFFSLLVCMNCCASNVLNPSFYQKYVSTFTVHPNKLLQN